MYHKYLIIYITSNIVYNICIIIYKLLELLTYYNRIEEKRCKHTNHLNLSFSSSISITTLMARYD